MLNRMDSAWLFEPFRAAGVTGLESYTSADAAVARIAAIYDKGAAILRDAFARFTAGGDRSEQEGFIGEASAEGTS